MSGNYIPKMIEDWKMLAKHIATGPPVNMANKIMDSASFLISTLEASSCWTINEQAFPLVWNTEISQLDMTNFRLPFPYMAIEYDFDYMVVASRGKFKHTLSADRDPACKRIILLQEINEKKFVLISAYTPDKLAMFREMGKGSLPLDRMNWHVSPLAIVFEYEAFNCIGEWMKDDGVDWQIAYRVYSNDRPYLGPAIAPALPMYAEVMDDMTEEQLDALTKDLADELKVAMGLLGILSCSNAPVTEVLPPEKLNKKRIKNGKAAIPTYRTLHVSDHREARGPTHGGSHASPRTHWRRGHIRNQHTAKGIIRKWIRPTLVNAGAGVPPAPEIVLT